MCVNHYIIKYMQKVLHAFQLNVKGRFLDYRLGQSLDLEKVKSFFEKRYQVKKLWPDQRHVLGILEKTQRKYFLKLATTEGISVVTQIEYRWNEQFNKLVPRNSSNVWVPQNFDSGYFNNKLFYLITDKLEGKLLSSIPQPSVSDKNIMQFLPKIIELSEDVQSLNITNLSSGENIDYQSWFVQKTTSWLKNIPQEIQNQYQVFTLLEVVLSGAKNLKKSPRHGDFTPWHIFNLTNKKLGLIDGEHARANGVEYYDMAYFIKGCTPSWKILT